MYAYASHISFNEMKDKIYIVDQRNSNIFAIDGVAKEVWDMLRAQLAVNEIIQNISTAYAIKVDEISRDIEELLLDFKESGLIVDASKV